LNVLYCQKLTFPSEIDLRVQDKVAQLLLCNGFRTGNRFVCTVGVFEGKKYVADADPE